MIIQDNQSNNSNFNSAKIIQLSYIQRKRNLSISSQIEGENNPDYTFRNNA